MKEVYVFAGLDFDTSTRAGAEGFFQVAWLKQQDDDGNETDISDRIYGGRHYCSEDELAETLVSVLKATVHLETEPA